MKHVRNRYFFAGDLILLTIATYLSFVLRLETMVPSRYLPGLFLLICLMIVIIPLAFRLAGIYSCYWQYASVGELVRVSTMVLLSFAIIGAVAVAVRGMPGVAQIPFSVVGIALPLVLLFTAAPRFAVRAIVFYAHRRGQVKRLSLWPVAIMGAGETGTMIAREIQQNPRLGMIVIGFLDDDPTKHSMRIHSLPVLGDRHAIPEIAQLYNLHRLIIAMPSAPGREIREIVRICEQIGIQTKTVPGLGELLNGTVHVNQLRNVQIEDLLRREAVQTDTAAVRDLIQGKRVLITGGGGSIGSELCRQVLRCEPSELIVVGHGENSVFEIQGELLQYVTGLRQQKEAGVSSSSTNGCNGTHAADHICQIHAVIADIRFADRICSVFEQYRPQIVFHAAAHKHVPLMEQNPSEAITNNVLGTRNVLTAAQSVGVERFVMISSDKAVNPTSIMGASKRAAELLVRQAACNSGQPYVAVRFGNVLGSRGSVVLTFKRQIDAGGPVTVTHPEMRRFFMTIPEAVQLVLQAAVLGQGGEVFMLDMGEPVKIVDLARTMIELSGLDVGNDIDIIYTGLRPGEKLYEELFVPGEEYQPTCHAKIFIARNASSFLPDHIHTAFQGLERAADQNNAESIRRFLHILVPEFQSVHQNGHDPIGNSTLPQMPVLIPVHDRGIAR